MSSQTNNLVKILKETGSDFEWYPTTNEILRILAGNIMGRFSSIVTMLDVGAGDGRVLTRVDEFIRERNDSYGVGDKFAIEKSDRLIAAMPSDICIVGTDFHRQTLIDKKVDVVFSNPPYSEYEEWSAKVIREANAEVVYLVIPDRWEGSREIAEALEARKGRAEVVGSFDFMKADRAARARVQLIRVGLVRNLGYSKKTPEIDPFELWFDEHFKIDLEKPAKSYSEEDSERRAAIADALVSGRNQVQVLTELYRADLDNLLSNYTALGTMDPNVLRELGVSLEGVRKGLRSKISGLKNVYWREVFEALRSITTRLTKDTREKMLQKFDKQMSVDFEEQNIYAVLIWALKNVNLYVDEQLKEVYLRMTSPENTAGYKSNIHFTCDEWRYGWRDQKQPERYKLDYRIVLENFIAIQVEDRGYSFEFKNGLHQRAHEYIGDILTICNNLGFCSTTRSEDHEWESGRVVPFHFLKDGDEEILCAVKAFKNGNIHVKFNKDVIRAINVEVGRLNGWLKTAQDATEELQDKGAATAWGTNFQAKGVPMLMASTQVDK